MRYFVDMEDDMNAEQPTVSTIVLALNEGKRIADCLKSISWADEIILIDNGSTDETKKIAKSLGAMIVEDTTRDFAHLHNIGKARAKGEWLLYVDADEVVSPELAKQIRNVIDHQSPVISGYELRRKNYYLGHPWPGDEYILRLMRKNALTEWYGTLHETARVKGAIGRLDAPLIHYTHRSLEEMVAKTNLWSETEAKLRYDANHPPVMCWRLFRVMMTAFWDSLIRQGGWKAGTTGWIESIYQAFSMFITYAKLWELQMKNVK